MMLAGRALLSIVCSFLVICGVGTSARALEAVDVNLQRDPQLLVTGYQRDDTGKQLLFFQLYNNYDTPLDLTQWQFYIDTVDEAHQISFSSLTGGFVRPKGHVIVSSAGYVAGASYSNMQAVEFTNKSAALLHVVPPTDLAERSATYTLRFAGDSTATTVDDSFVGMWLRNQSTTAGYNTTFALSTTSQIIDNLLYVSPPSPAARVVEVYAYSSDCAPNDISVLCGDFIKVYVGTEDVSEYVLRTSNNSTSRTTANTFYLEDYPVINGYITVSLTEKGDRVSLTNSGGYIWLEDIYGLQRYDATMTYYTGFGSKEQGYSWMLSDEGMWQWSTTPSPYGDNIVTVPVTSVTVCPEGKYLNPDTNRCRTLEEAVNALATCPEGQYRNPATNRCKQLMTTASTLKPCDEGQERNPVTNRCRSIVSAVAELIPCKDGYERNPETNRCRKVSAVLAASAGGETLTGDAESTTSPLAAWGWTIAAIAGAGAVGYGVYEWRHEIANGWKSLRTRIGRK